MAYDVNGTYTLTYTWATEAASPPIAISKLDTEMAGIATGLSLAILRNGNGKPTANIDWNDKKITNLANATADADALNRITADGRYAVLSGATFTGTVTATGMFVTASEASVWLTSSASGTDEKTFRWVSSAGVLYLQTANDAGSSFATAITVDRTGTTVDAIALAATAVTVNGGTVWHSGNDGAGSGLDADTVDGIAPTSGSFTVTLRPSNGGATLASGTATWKKFNNIVSLFIPQLLTTNTSAALYLDDLPADVLPGTSQICLAFGENAGNPVPIRVQLVSDYALLALTDNSGFTTSATSKGIYASTLTYTA